MSQSYDCFYKFINKYYITVSYLSYILFKIIYYKLFYYWIFFINAWPFKKNYKNFIANFSIFLKIQFFINYLQKCDLWLLQPRLQQHIVTVINSCKWEISFAACAAATTCNFCKLICHFSFAIYATSFVTVASWCCKLQRRL